MNMIDGYHIQNCKTVLHWTTGWLLGANSLNLSSFFNFSSSPASSFFPQGFDAPMLRFYLFSNVSFFSFFQLLSLFKVGEGAIMDYPCLASPSYIYITYRGLCISLLTRPPSSPSLLPVSLLLLFQNHRCGLALSVC